ncbi:DUF262 domain-containing protein [Chamaesiphon minutus]|uniref:GmrSD restriction endonucleases N-terminal domain-containing protein n=1 Tax=Chamaesiphon minutus (strain ATCC 27169 / PCC 6605) TaxID=1173020 RepID=K9UGT4_CHAP6|nr:DUF262 domain-containing protein [Chamaesiphon minutus]AFY94307.1 Protein of unknown function DUF262 [Chamaesiphon minutus PCC 6605]
MTTRTLGQLLYALRKGDLLLPNFQRPFVWNPERWQSLLASILLEYPVGQALIGTEANSKMMSINRPLSIPEKTLKDVLASKANISSKDTEIVKSNQCLQKGDEYSCDYLLDGQQRLTALDLIFGNAYHFSEGSELNRSYRLRWFLNLNKLGLDNLEWLDIREIQHEEMCDVFVSVKYRRTDKKSPIYYSIPDGELADFCTVSALQRQFEMEEGIYLPLDQLYFENESSNSLELDPTRLLMELFDYRQETIIVSTKDGQALKRKFDAGEIEEIEYNQEREKLKKKFLIWKTRLEHLLGQIIKFPFPVLEVPSKDFNRLSGIFSVINMGSVALDTFDLLVAKTTTTDRSLRDVVKNECSQNFKEYNKNIEKYTLMLPDGARGKDVASNFWNIGKFLGEKSEEADQVNQGSKFPESISRSFAQAIVLHAQLNQALGDDWSTRSNILQGYTSYQNAARHIFQSENWGYSDKLILALSRDVVHKVQSQAVKQLLRAYFLMKSKLGVEKLSTVPYRPMDLVLSSVLTDSVWKKILKDPNGTIIKKIEWWYWGSIFGGAYQKAYSSVDKRILSDIPRLIAYISDPKIKWSDVSDLNDGISSNQYLTESSILGSEGKNRFEMICNVDGYSTKEALMSSPGSTMQTAILSFSIKNGLSDFKFRDKSGSNESERGERLHIGRGDLQIDHLYAVNLWYRFTGEKIDRNTDHPVNSPLNYAWISSKANRYWSDNPSFQKLEIESAIKGSQDSIDFLHEHFLSIESVECEYSNISIGSEDYQKENAPRILKSLLEKRFEKLRQSILAENPEK